MNEKITAGKATWRTFRPSDDDMRILFLCCALPLAVGVLHSKELPLATRSHNEVLSPRVTQAQLGDVIRIEADPEKGFMYPYYYYVPQQLRAEEPGATKTVCVLPNNTGATDDDLAVHDASAKRLAEGRRQFAAGLKVALLVPVFPRPRKDGRIYTHALDRDSVLTDKAELKRFDLQLIRMIEDARIRLRVEGLNLDSRVVMYGFSAAGMFTNRFAMLHPDRLKAAAFGSPGGWAMAPVPTWRDQELRYPIGTGDFEMVTGAPFDLSALQGVPLFLFMGGDDTNDSVVYRDSYDQEDRDLIFKLFGKTPMERWPVTEGMYAASLPRATLKLYPKVGHTVTDEMWSDVAAFFAAHLRD